MGPGLLGTPNSSEVDSGYFRCPRSPESGARRSVDAGLSVTTREGNDNPRRVPRKVMKDQNGSMGHWGFRNYQCDLNFCEGVIVTLVSLISVCNYCMVNSSFEVGSFKHSRSKIDLLLSKEIYVYDHSSVSLLYLI